MPKIKTFHYFIILVVLLFSTSPFFLSDRIGKFILFVFLLLFTFLLNKKVEKKIFIVILIVLILGVVQGLIWSFKLSTLFFYICLVVLIPYFTIRIVGISYLKMLSQIIFISSIITLPFWLLQNFYSPFDKFLLNLIEIVFPYNFDLYPRALLIYTYEGMTVDFFGINLYRNAGIFHEPGGYAVFLNISIVINLMREKILFSKKNIFMILLIFLSTFSTAGMLGVFVIIMFYFYQNKKVNRLQRITLLIFSGLILSYIFFNSQFLNSKIINNYERESSIGLYKETSGRFTAATKSMLVLSRYPVTGRGLTEASRAEIGSDESTGGYGFMAFFAQYGILLSVGFIFYFYKACKVISFFYSGSTYYSNIFFFSLSIGLFSQAYISTPIISMIFFIGLYNNYLSKIRPQKDV